MNWLVVDKILLNAIKEDISGEDITTNSIISKVSISTVDLIAKEKGVLAGLEVFERVFTLMGDVEVEFYKEEGQEVEKGSLIGKLKGNTEKILSGERTALNILQRMSGIATLTRKFVKQIENTDTKLLDTRKTTPNLRILEKYAVKVGGGENHRFNLSDGILLKDNHINAAGGIKNAVEMVRKNISFVRKVEVEVENMDMVRQAIDAKVDIIMLDNMNIEDMKKAVEFIDKRAIIEASGNVTLESIRKIAETGVEYISVGGLTHSYKALDISMKNLINS